MSKNKLFPDYLFEVSWEVCNKVGGIHTVVSTKAQTLNKALKDNFILIGPDVWKETVQNPEFIEERFLFKTWREHAEGKGLKFRIGRWNIAGNPIVILVDFTPYFMQKDAIFTTFWESYKLDSISGQWDYTEPTMFGYAAAKIIESFYEFNVTAKDKIIAQFHEWMTGSGVLYLKKNVPQIGTIFTTHATVLGRSIAGNNMPLYSNLENFNPEIISRNFNVTAKQSSEKTAAIEADAFTTVSEITAKECLQFLGKSVDVVTPNGFEDDFVPKNEDFEKKREIAKNKLVTVAEAVLNQKSDVENTVFVANSGRYEFKNKGLDIFIKSLGQLNKNYELKKNVVVFILVPGNNAGPKRDVLERIHNNDYINPVTDQYLTHWLHDPDIDPVLKSIKENNLRNLKEDKVKIIFAPIYLNATDGIFNLSYFDLLIGFDITVFPSYYEPWGYTPMESMAFKIPTITTTLAGFGKWITSSFGELANCINVIKRTDDNDNEAIKAISEHLYKCNIASKEDKLKARDLAFNISRSVLWNKLIVHYYEAYNIALQKVELRQEKYITKQIPEYAIEIKSIKNNTPQWKKVLIKSYVPKKLMPLVKLSKNLWWSWNHDAIELFENIDPALWKKSQKNPIIFLEELSFEQISELEKNETFISKLEDVYDRFDSYLQVCEGRIDEQVAYFSMEFGLHDTVKIFSGGLGVLAGDYLKEASDSNRNIVGIGLLYRYGYFTQTLSPTGEQISEYIPQKFSNMPLLPVRNEKGDWVTITIAFPGRQLTAKIWKLSVGRISLYLLDTDIAENTDEDKSITYQLYGGDLENRLKQEILLGIGGARLLDVLGYKPDVYHCNEGHAAFVTVERIRRLIELKHLSFQEASEVVRATTLFTTHTPVPAGHDAFNENLLRIYMPHFPEKMNISWDDFINLGKVNENDPDEKFSMSVLAVKLSQEVNGVSKIHGDVSRKMFNNMYEGYFNNELHIGYVTNGVHVPTWIARDWYNLYKEVFGKNFVFSQQNHDMWKKIHDVPDIKIWEIRKKLKKELFSYLKTRLMENLTSRQENPSMVLEMIDCFNEDALTIGFARRFATYKRAHLLFKNLKKLSELVNKADRPIQFIFAGKAHPQDKAGQDLIKNIINISRMPEFLGKIVFIENYDMDLAQKLVQGVDVWLNTPTRPLEASGTSGEKAIMNGVMNLSVLDGWWAEGYVPGAGWALPEERTYQNQVFQDDLDAETIYNLLEHDLSAKYYNFNSKMVSPDWISHIKNTIADIAPRFTMRRQIDDYYKNYYNKLFERSKGLIANDYENVRKISKWKKKIIRSWKSIEVVSVNVPDSNAKPLHLGDKFNAEVILNLHELTSEDIGIEIVFGQKVMDAVREALIINELKIEDLKNGHTRYYCQIKSTHTGVFDYSFRIFPKHKLLPHRQDFGLVRWI
ncbi:MAG: alpha-glucan phosphorylase [Bacteroidetes bacterium GWA2_30_7]|nr:MAG: alpha-glucan phosphorylase [Bacteroidetes bacterium GWA2_30_7]